MGGVRCYTSSANMGLYLSITATAQSFYIPSLAGNTLSVVAQHVLHYHVQAERC